MKTRSVVHKYGLTLGYSELSLAHDAEILSVDGQHGRIAMWVRLNRDSSVLRRQFLVVATGVEFEHLDLKFIGTVLLVDGNLVYHVFETT